MNRPVLDRRPARLCLGHDHPGELVEQRLVAVPVVVIALVDRLLAELRIDEDEGTGAGGHVEEALEVGGRRRGAHLDAARERTRRDDRAQGLLQRHLDLVRTGLLNRLDVRVEENPGADEDGDAPALSLGMLGVHLPVEVPEDGLAVDGGAVVEGHPLADVDEEFKAVAAHFPARGGLGGEATVGLFEEEPVEVGVHEPHLGAGRDLVAVA